MEKRDFWYVFTFCVTLSEHGIKYLVSLQSDAITIVSFLREVRTLQLNIVICFS